MKKTLLLFLVLILVTACNYVAKTATEEQIDMEYAGTVVLTPIIGESGDDAIKFGFSGGGWTKNSGRCFNRVAGERDGGRIVVRVFTAVCGGEVIPPILDLNADLEGEFEVQLKDPDGTLHTLGRITFP